MIYGFSAIDIIFSTALSTLALFVLAIVVMLHHHNKTKPFPQWIHGRLLLDTNPKHNNTWFDKYKVDQSSGEVDSGQDLLHRSDAAGFMKILLSDRKKQESYDRNRTD